MVCTPSLDIESAVTHPVEVPGMIITEAENRYLRCCAGNIEAATSSDAAAFLRHFRHLLCRCKPPYLRVLRQQYNKDLIERDRIFFALSDLIEVYCADPDISINRAIQSLVSKGTINYPQNAEEQSITKQCMFSALGMTTLLFVPSPTQELGRFEIDAQGASCFFHTSVGMAMSARPFDELLRAFGEVLPKAQSLPSGQVQTPNQSSIKFHVSQLNAATLKRLGNIKLVWVESIGAHLDFDPTVPALHIFNAPSFCRLHGTKDSILSVLLGQACVQNENPVSDFSIRALMTEIILSYGLLFRDDRSSRKLYRKTERMRAVIDEESNLVDPLIDKLCGMDMSTSIFSIGQPVREFYDSRAEFPILAARLFRLQDYTAGIKPGRLTSPWQDSRDRKSWYTLWAVLVFGVIGIAVGIISIGVRARQLAVAVKAYNLQLSQAAGMT